MNQEDPESFDFASSRALDLHGILAEMRVRGPVVQAVYHGKPAWVITSHAELREAFRNEECFQSGTIQEPLVGKTMQSMTGDTHRVNRSLVAFAFVPRSIRAQVETLLEPLARRLVGELPAHGAFDLMKEFSNRFPAAVITRMLGIPVRDELEFLDWAIKLFQFPWDPNGARVAWRSFRAYLEPILRERRECPGDDLISVLIASDLDGRALTDDEILSFIGILYPAGSDTALKALGSMMYAVLTHPHVQEAVLQNPSESAAIAEEALRWEPPVAVLPRRVARSCHFGGVEMEVGEDVLFGIAGANDDPRIFESPREFNPLRAGIKQSLVFGHGAHICLGAQLARQEMGVALNALLERFPAMKLVTPESVQITGAILRGPRELLVQSI